VQRSEAIYLYTNIQSAGYFGTLGFLCFRAAIFLGEILQTADRLQSSMSSWRDGYSRPRCTRPIALVSDAHGVVLHSAFDALMSITDSLTKVSRVAALNT
jgi:hypothetical protein